jgi:signal transduction histidine kinase
MTDGDEELRYYRRRVEELGRRLLAAEEHRRYAQIEADKATRSLSLLRDSHELIDTADSLDAFYHLCLQKICSITMSDSAAIFETGEDAGLLVPLTCCGLLEGALTSMPVSPPLQAFEVYNDRQRESCVLSAVAQQTGYRHFAWAWDERRGRGLLVMRKFLGGPHRPFSFADQGILQAALAIFDEVCRRKQAQEALFAAKIAAEDASLAKSRFLAMMSHELRTPLNAVLGFSEMIKAETGQPHRDTPVGEYAEMIHSSGTQLLRIISDILDISQLETDRFELRETRVRLADLIRRCTEPVRLRAAEKGIAFDVDIASSRQFLIVDEKRINQAVGNILDNAVKFTGQGGAVRVSVSGSNGCGLSIEIADTGLGMTADDIARAFEPFGQVDGRLARKSDGIGLGLPLSRIFVERHGGAITIDSAPDEGTRVRITLPSDRLL